MNLKLTTENYKEGYLIDEEWLGGVAPTPSNQYEAFIINHVSAEPVARHIFQTLEQALRIFNNIDRNWNFESFSGCGGGKCGQSKKCGTECCPKKK